MLVFADHSLPNGLEDMGTYINRGSCNKITKELSSSKIDESSVGQWIEIGEHDQLQCGQLRSKLCSVYRCAFTGDFMIRPKNLQNVLNLSSLIIIRGEVHILRSSDAKDLGYVVWIEGKLFSSYLAF